MILKYDDKMIEIYLHNESHIRLQLEDLEGTSDEKMIEALKKREDNDVNVFYLTVNERKNITGYAAVRKVHVNTNHKSAKNMIYAYTEAGLLDDKVRGVIKRVIYDCKICRKKQEVF